MVDLKNEIKFNNENHGLQSTIHFSKNMQETARKKQAFGELKNVMHNQCQPKTLKFENISNKTGNCTHSSKYLNSVVVQAPEPVVPINLTQDAQKYEEEIELLNYFDIDRSCCAKPYKSDRQIWSELNMFDDSLIDEILQSGNHDEEEDPATIEDYSLDDSGCEDLLNLNNSMLFTANRINDDNDEDLLPPPPLPTLGDMLDFDDLYLEM